MPVMREVTRTPALDASGPFFTARPVTVIGIARNISGNRLIMPIHIAPSFTVYPENLKTRIPNLLQSFGSEIDFLDNLSIEERNQPLLMPNTSFRFALMTRTSLDRIFHHVDDFPQAVAFSSDCTAAHKVFSVIVAFFELRQLGTNPRQFHN